HISGLVDEIREGDEVEFDLQDGRKGLNAVNVKVI
ncbi:MAG: CspA family cold shock protein, partial [Psychroserpens sp.]